MGVCGVAQLTDRLTNRGTARAAVRASQKAALRRTSDEGRRSREYLTAAESRSCYTRQPRWATTVRAIGLSFSSTIGMVAQTRSIAE
jgi:hypothetical protein